MTNLEPGSFGSHPERPLRTLRDPMFSGLDVAAFVVSLFMVCMPLAFGALGL